MRPFTTENQAIKHIESINRRRNAFKWGITLKKEGQNVIGTCEFHHFKKTAQRADLGYLLAQSHWNRGIMTEALKELIIYGFNTLKLVRIQAYVLPSNIGSIRVLEKLNFELDGRLRSYTKWIGMGIVDVSLYSLLNHDKRDY